MNQGLEGFFLLGARGITRSSYNKEAYWDTKVCLYKSTLELLLNITGMNNSSPTLTADQGMRVDDNKLCNFPLCWSLRLPSGVKCFRYT